MKKDYSPVVADETLEDDCRQLIRLAIREDLERSLDWTTVCLIDDARRGRCAIVPRQAGIAAGLVTVPWIIDEMDVDLQTRSHLSDGQSFEINRPVVTLEGNARDLLTSERVLLNMLSRLSGIATLTASYVKQIEGTPARLYDTRKTTPGYRRLEKYGVRCGGGHNHRTGLFDGFLVKDNHLALGGPLVDGVQQPLSARTAAEKVRAWSGGTTDSLQVPTIIEIEVDSLSQLADVLPAQPDIVLVDNFSLEQLRQAVELRDQLAPNVELEASGNVKIDTIRLIAMTGVERISSGALTHQAVWLDLGMDWSADFAT